MSSRGSNICWRDQISVQISADIFADICKYLHISADICKYLQISADICRYLHKARRYNIIEAQLTMQSISYYTDSSLCPHLALPHCHHCCTIVRSPCPSTFIQPFATIPLLSGWAPEQQRQKFNLSPTGSTVSVKNDTDPSQKNLTPSTLCSLATSNSPRLLSASAFPRPPCFCRRSWSSQISRARRDW